ncbi:MAG: hypothetical protein O7A06_17550 [Acidobacteria bacterium]|nr:hypothetical protein [Acidobacteriota bacterium]
MNKALAVLLVLVISAAGICAAAEEVAILPVSEVRPGMKGIAYSVFEGNEPEAFPVEVIGVLKNVWGPRQHIILVRAGGRVEQTGVAAGMSGSPVYIDGKLLGAISLRIGVFSTEPIAGVTPAENMLEIREMDPSEPAHPALPMDERAKGANTEADPLLAALGDILPPSLRSSSAGNNYLVPIETPLAFSGFSDSVLDFFAPVFRRMGVVAIQGGAETQSVSSVMPSPEDLASALPPGSAVAGMLVTGDLSLAGTGTVTYNDGRRVLAFGHRFFGFGPVEMPMSQAEILMVVPSSYASFKIANSTRVVGSIVQDRHSGIMGILGKPARMIPVTTTLRDADQSTTYHYEVFQNSKWTPAVMMFTLFSTLARSNQAAAETSFKVNGTIEIEGYPSVTLDSMHATPTQSRLPPAFSVALWLTQRFNRIFQNQFEQPEISSVHLEFEIIPELRFATLINVWSATTEVHPGDQLPVKIFLQPYRGERIVKETTVQIPWSVSKGRLKISISDAKTVSQTQERTLIQQKKATSLRDIISGMNRERSNQELYVTLLQATPTAFLGDKLLPSIPSTIANVMDSASAANRLTVINETAIERFSIPMDVVVAGTQTLNLTVK